MYLILGFFNKFEISETQSIVFLLYNLQVRIKQQVSRLPNLYIQCTLQPIVLLDEKISLKPPTVPTRLVFSRVADSKVISHHDMSKGLMWIFYAVVFEQCANNIIFVR